MSEGARNPFLVAAEAGLSCIEPEERDIFVDLDSQQDEYVMAAILALLKENGYFIDVVKITRSQHGNKHAYLRGPVPLSDTERLFLQAILGSDRKREALGLIRSINGFKPVTVFFEVPSKESEGTLKEIF
mgnify:CR=1 FL=1